MSDVNANIGVHIDTSEALAQLKNLQRQIATFHSQISKSSAAAALAQKNLQTNLLNAVNATGMFHAQMGTVRTSAESFTDSLEKNKFSMREYFRYAGGASKTFGRLFRQEFDTIGKVAEERVKKMQTQYIKMGRDASGAMRAMSITPNTLNMNDYATKTAIAAQKQALFNQLVKQGSTNLLNFGKNTQWAGRQLMVGFTVPLMYLGTVAGKTFMDLEQQALKFKRVYGEMFTTSDQTEKALKDVERLAKEFTKYGVAVSKTMEMAASAAAMGKTGAELTAQVAQATRLAVLGNVEQEQALETTISVTNAFGIAAEDLAKKIDFLNAVENQTVVSIEDLTIAIPKAGPVVKQLGGDVEDLAFFLTAMKEGGINASEGANALKSGLASLINPSKKAAAMLNDLGINIKGIVEGNAGNVKDTVIEFSQALDTLDPLNRARAIEQLFGKFQFSRLSTLFQNVTKDGTQANRVLELSRMEIEELAILSERELKTIEDAVGTNFKSAVENLKLSIAPIGKTFLEAVTPIVKAVSGILEKFNGLSDGTKKFIVVATTLVGVVGPTLLMTFGLLMNAVANGVKLFALLRTGFLRLSGNSKILGASTQYLNSEQLEAATIAASLNQAHTKLTQSFNLETVAVRALRQAYIDATIAATKFAMANPGMMAPKAKGKPPGKFAKGATYVPGRGNKDTVPAVLTPGEAVIPSGVAQDPRFQPIIDAMVNGNLQAFSSGETKVTQSGKKEKAKPMAKKDAFAHVGKAVSTPAEDYIKQTPGLSEYDKARIRAVDGLEKAAGRSGVVTDYRGLGFAFDQSLNTQLAKKNGVPLDVFEKEWMAQGSEKWDATKDRKLVKNLYGPDNALIDDAMIKKIREEAAKNGGKVTDDIVKKSFQELPASVKATATYRAMDTAFQARSQYGVGKGMSHSPKTMEKKFKAAMAAGTIAKAPIIIIDGDATTYNGKPTPLGKDGKPQKLSTLLGTPGFELPEKAHVIVERTDSRGRKKSGSIFAYDPRFPQPIFISKGASTTRANVGRNPGLITTDQVKEIKKRLSARSVEEMKRIDSDVRASSMARVKPTDFGRQVAPTSGYSFPVAGIGGVYEKDGKRTFVKPMVDERSARAELRANLIARQVHGLDTPEQTMKVMADPNNKKRKIIVLASDFDPRFSEEKMTGKFTKDQYFRQLVASLLRGDKDLKRGNLSGNILTDPGAAGVFDRASGRREYSTGMKSMLTQAEINLLGVKGGASKDFAKATVSIPRGMTADQYHKTMIAEIDRVLPKLREVVASFGLTDPVEKAVYKDMIARLERGRTTDWRGIHKMHSSVLVTKDEVLEDDKTKRLSPIKKKRKPRSVQPIVPSAKDKYIAPIPKGKSVVQKPLKLRGRSDAPLSQAEQIRQRAAQEGVSASTARRRLLAEGKLIKATEKQSASLAASTAAVDDNKKATRSSKETIQAFGAKANLAMGATSALTIAATFAGGKIGEMAQKIMPFVFGLQGILLILPLLMNPLVGIPLAIGAVVAGLWFFKKKQDDAVKAEARLVDELYATTKKMQQVGEVSGKVGASQLMARKRENATGDFSFQRKGIKFGSAFLQSEVGKADIAAFEARFKAMPDIAMREFSLKLASYVSDGVIDAAQAASIADQVGIEFQDKVLGMKIQGQLQSLITLDGKDLSKEPFEIRIKIAEETVSEFNNLVPNLQDQLESTAQEVERLSQKLLISLTSWAAGDITDEELDGIQAELRSAEARLKSIENSVKQNSSFAAGMASQAYEGIQAQIDAIEVSTSKSIDKLKAEKATTKDLEKQASIQKEIERLERNRESAISKLKGMNDKVTKGIEKQLELSSATEQAAYFTGSAESVRSRFKGTRQQADAELLLAKTAQVKAPVLRAQIEAVVSSGQLGPNQGTGLLNLFADDQAGLEKTFTTYLNFQGIEDLNKLQSILGGFKDQKLAKSLLINLGGLSDSDFQSQYSVLEQLMQLDGEEINLEVALKENPNLLRDLAEVNTAIKGMKNVTKDNVRLVLESITLANGQPVGQSEINGITDNWSYFASLPEELRKTALTTYISLFSTIFATKEAREEWARNLAREKASKVGSSAQEFVFTQTYKTVIDAEGNLTEEGKKALAGDTVSQVQDIIGAFEALNKVNSKGGATDDGTAAKQSSLASLLEILKRTRDASIDAAGGAKELMRILGGKKDLKFFTGIDQQLSQLGANSDFIDFVGGLENAVKEKIIKINKDGVVSFGEFGEAAKKGYDEKQLGLFSAKSALAITAAQKQRDAFVKLSSTGVESSDALDMLADSTFAVSLAAQKNPEEIKRMVAEWKAMRKEVETTLISTDPQEYFKQQMAIANKQFDYDEALARRRYQPQIEAAEKSIKANNDLIESNQRRLEVDKEIGNRRIDIINDEIDALERSIETGVDKQLQALQDESDRFSEDRTTIGNVVDKINEKYDLQEEALKRISAVNQEIISQQKGQLSLADALSKGDISAAASAVQDIRAADAEAAAQRAQEALQLAREAETGRIRGTLTGLTAKEISEKQYQNDRATYLLNKQRSDTEKKIAEKQEQIYQIQLKRQPVIAEITRLEDDNYRINMNILKPLQDKLDSELDFIEAQKTKWTDAQLAIDGANLKTSTFTGKLTAAETLLTSMSGLWKNLTDKNLQLTIEKIEKVIREEALFVRAGTVTTKDGLVDVDAQGRAKDGSIPLAVDASTPVEGAEELRKAAAELAKSVAGLNSAKFGPKFNPTYKADGGLISGYFASGGFASGTDTVPAMLTPGEYVLRKSAVEKYGVDNLDAMNVGYYHEGGPVGHRHGRNAPATPKLVPGTGVYSGSMFIPPKYTTTHVETPDTSEESKGTFWDKVGSTMSYKSDGMMNPVGMTAFGILDSIKSLGAVVLGSAVPFLPAREKDIRSAAETTYIGPISRLLGSERFPNPWGEEGLGMSSGWAKGMDVASILAAILPVGMAARTSQQTAANAAFKPKPMSLSALPVAEQVTNKPLEILKKIVTLPKTRKQEVIARQADEARKTAEALEFVKNNPRPVRPGTPGAPPVLDVPAPLSLWDETIEEILKDTANFWDAPAPTPQSPLQNILSSIGSTIAKPVTVPAKIISRITNAIGQSWRFGSNSGARWDGSFDYWGRTMLMREASNRTVGKLADRFNPKITVGAKLDKLDPREPAINALSTLQRYMAPKTGSVKYGLQYRNIPKNILQNFVKNPLIRAKNSLSELKEIATTKGLSSSNAFVRNMAAARNLGANATHYRVQAIVDSMPGGFEGLLQLLRGVHRARAPYTTAPLSIYERLAMSKTGEGNIPVNAYGPGNYFATSSVTSKRIFEDFGPYAYKTALTPSAILKVLRSKGFATSEEVKRIAEKRGMPNVSLEGIAHNADHPLMQALIDEGYLGYRHNDAFTNWMMGIMPGMGFKLVDSPKVPDVVASRLADGSIDMSGTAIPKTVIKRAKGGIVPKYFAAGGYSMGTDTVPAMLTPGEFVMSKYAVDTYGLENMKSINSGAALGETVYNYQLNVNVKSDANPEQIANVVMGQIRQIESKRLRGNRL